MNQQAQIARIQRNQAEVREFVAEQHKLMAEQAKILRGTFLAPWQLVITGMVAGGALFGAGAAFMKLIGA